MDKAKDVVSYYCLCNKLKTLIRKGWIDWKVRSDRIESVAEHIYGVQMLALAMYYKYDYDINIMKVIFMLAIHELGETIIGDLTLFDISREEKEKIEHEAVFQILSSLTDEDNIKKLFLEFDSKSTPEAIFAYQCDKLECDIQSKLYDQEGYIDLEENKDNQILSDGLVKSLIESGKSFSNMWLEFSQKRYPYDKNFMSVSEYVKNNKIEEEITKKFK